MHRLLCHTWIKFEICYGMHTVVRCRVSITIYRDIRTVIGPGFHCARIDCDWRSRSSVVSIDPFRVGFDPWQVALCHWAMKKLKIWSGPYNTVHPHSFPAKILLQNNGWWRTASITNNHVYVRLSSASAVWERPARSSAFASIAGVVKYVSAAGIQSQTTNQANPTPHTHIALRSIIFLFVIQGW